MIPTSATTWPQPARRSTAPQPFYYLENFRTALRTLEQRYGDLLSAAEARFLHTFESLPALSAALLVRMINRKGELFRACRLRYAEIGAPEAAAAPLVTLGWLDPDPLIGIEELGRVLRRAELTALGGPLADRRATKRALLCRLLASSAPARPWSSWCPGSEPLYRLRVHALCEVLRLLFFGNGRQTWAEFVLADLGIFRYERIRCDALTRAFHTREQIEIFLQIHRCEQRLDSGEDPQALLPLLPEPLRKPLGPDHWLERRLSQLEFALGRHCERAGLTELALGIYGRCGCDGARTRQARLLERSDRCEEALQVTRLRHALQLREFERQELERVELRIRRRRGASVPRRSGSPWPTLRLRIANADEMRSPERTAAAAFARSDAPVFFVESRLINSLFGLLFWDAIFAPLPGAFFHQFQGAPADLYMGDFAPRRSAQLACGFALLASAAHREAILHQYREKQGIQSPFVSWGMLTRELLGLALECIAPAHLQLYFTRLLQDLQANRTGLPDLVQFQPAERSYRLIEVKGPGDRLQDNQRRWLQFCAAHRLPVQLCHIERVAVLDKDNSGSFDAWFFGRAQIGCQHLAGIQEDRLGEGAAVPAIAQRME